MGDVLLSKLSAQLSELDDEILEIDKQIGQLRRKKATLLESKKTIEQKIELKTNEDDDVVLERWDCDGFEWSDNARKILEQSFKLKEFRPLQRAAINAVMSKEDTIVIMSTGGGKSLCYQLPALLAEGLTLVVSPLISLVEDQIHQLTKLGIQAASLNASTPKEEVKRIEEAITNKNSAFRLLYVTPEKLAKSKRIMNKLEKSLAVGFLKLIAIDEVHCCSQWGHDFRTDYAFLNVLKRQFEGVPILGLTATATSNVLEDIKEMLGIKASLVFKTGFNRENLKYEVAEKSASEDECLTEIAAIIRTKFKNQTGIVYCLSRNDCEKVANGLRKHGISAKHYHAYMEPHERTKSHENWLSGKYQVIVATVAFGMGIDKPNVRFVIHHSIPKSIENYYQESGRAGRDGKPAECVLFYRMADVFKQSSMVQQEKAGISNLYNVVRYATEYNTCRRVRLAEHFEETWDASWCRKQCDVCQNEASGDIEQIDVRDEAKFVVELINDAASSVNDGSGKLTGNKLAELLTKKFKNRTKKFCERLIICLLLNSFLQETFHYTVYSVISYVTIGFKWRTYDGKSPIFIPFLKTKNAVKNSTGQRKRKAPTVSDNDDDNDGIVVLD